MALSFGWRANDTRESIWRDDTALQNVSAAALEDWQTDGDASHRRKFATAGQPTIVTFRALTPDESRVAMAMFFGSNNALESYTRATLICFRIGVDFKGAPDKIRYNYRDEHGTPVEGEADRIIKEKSLRMLASEFVADLETRYPGIVGFYGGLIYRATYPDEVEKKASSPQSMQTPSSAAEPQPTAATTAPSPNGEAA